MKGFLYTIEQFFRARDALGGIEVDAEVFNSFLEVITSIKFDRIFDLFGKGKRPKGKPIHRFIWHPLAKFFKLSESPGTGQFCE